MKQPTPLPPESLRARCAPERLGFHTTDELPSLSKPIGQPRAFRALALGLPGSGRTTLVMEFLRQRAAQEPTPPDLVYVYNFAEPKRPRALCFPPGHAATFAEDMRRLIRTCRQEIPRAFRAESYRKERERLTEELKRQQEAEFTRLQALVSKYNFALVQTPFGFLLVPAVEGRPLSAEELERLDEEKRRKLDELRERLEMEVKKTLRKVRQLEQKTRQAIEDLDRRTTAFVVEHLVEDLKTKYAEVEGVADYLEEVKEDIIQNGSQFRAEKDEKDGEWAWWARRYEVNVLVDNGQTQGAPVVLENHPSYASWG